MKLYLPMFALCAAGLLVSGCGGLEEEAAADGVPPRMKDVVYTNQLSNFRNNRSALAAREASIRSKLSRLGTDAKSKPEYVALTNELAKCKAENAQLRKNVVTVMRTRLLKDAAKKGNLK